MYCALRDKTVLKEYFRYVPFSVLAMIAMSCYILADTYFISQGLGTYGLSALNLAIPIYYFIHGTGLMLGMGGATRYSVLRSKGEEDKANAVFTNTLYLAAAFSVIFVLVGVFLSGNIARLLGADQYTYEMTEIYLRVLLLFSPAFTLNNVLVCFVRNDGAPRLAMASTVTGSLSNILLDWVFIFPCKMGMFGAVFATGLAPVIGVCVSCIHLVRRKNNFKFVKVKPNARTMGVHFALGFPSLVEQLSSAIVILVFNFIILDISGNTGVAAYGVVANISLVVASVFTGIAQGVQPLVSRAHGEGERGQEKSYLLYALITALIFSVIVYAVIFFFAGQIADVFNRDKDALLTELAAEGMRLYFTAIPFVGFNVITCTFFTSSEKPLPAHIVSLLRGLVVVIPAAFALSAVWGLTGVWLSYPVTEGIVAAVAAVILYLISRRAPSDSVKKHGLHGGV